MSLFCSRDFDSDELEDDRVPPPSVLKQEIQDRFAPVSLPDLPPPPQDQPPVYPEESSQSTVGALSMENSRVTSTKKVVIGKKPVVKSIKKSLKHAASSEVSRCKKAATAPKRCRRPSSGPKPETSPHTIESVQSVNVVNAASDAGSDTAAAFTRSCPDREI